MAEIASPRATRWLFGPLPDLLLGCGLLYGLLLAGFVADGPAIRAHQPHFLFPLLFLALGAPHYGATLLRVYEQRAERRRYALFAVWATLAIAAAFVAGLASPWVAAWLLTIYLTWSPWHYTGQNYGLAVMFLRRRATPFTVGDKRLLYASFVLSYALIFLLFHGPVDSSPRPEFQTGEGGMFRSLGIPPGVYRTLFPALAAAYLAVTGVALARLRRRAAWRDLQPSLLLMATQALWFALPATLRYWHVPTGIEPLSWSLRPYYFFWIALGHSVQYLWITTYYARESAGFHGYGAYLGKALLAGAALWTLPIVIFDPKFAGDLIPDPASVGLLVAACVNIHHFVLDGAIWKLRHMPIARVLIRDVPAQPEAGSAAVGERGFGRRAVWTLAAAGFALAAFKYVHRDVLYPRALGRQDWDAARAVMERYGWVAEVSQTARDQLADAEAASAQARRQQEHRLERRLGLRPGVEAYRRRAQMDEERGDWQAAIGEYRAALKLDPQNPALLRDLRRAERRLAGGAAAD
jgi:hypothetical protein